MTSLRKISFLTAFSILFANGYCIAGSPELIHADECCHLKKSTAEQIGEAAGEAAGNVEKAADEAADSIGKAADDLGKGAKKGYKKVQ